MKQLSTNTVVMIVKIIMAGLTALGVLVLGGPFWAAFGFASLMYILVSHDMDFQKEAWKKKKEMDK